MFCSTSFQCQSYIASLLLSSSVLIVLPHCCKCTMETKLFKTKILQLSEIGVFKKSEPLSIAANLLTFQSLLRFGTFTNIVSYLGSTKFLWNKEEQQFEWNNRPWRELMYYFSKFVITLNSAYLLGRFVHARMYGGLDFTEMTLLFMWLGTYAMLTVINFNIIVEGEEVLYCLNHLIFAVIMLEG